MKNGNSIVMPYRTFITRLRPHLARASWSVAEQAISPLLMIALTPFLLKQFGADQFGLWMLVMAIVSFGQLTSLGAGTATIKHVSADLENGDRQNAVNTIRAAVTIALFGGGGIALAVFAAAPMIAKIFFPRMGPVYLVSEVITIGAILLLVQELDNVFSSALRGAQRYDLSAKVELFTRLMWAIGVFLLAWKYPSIVAVLIGILVLSIIKTGFKAREINRLLNVTNCHWPSIDGLYLRRVGNFGKWQWIQSVGGMLFSVADRLLVGAIFGATDLARYSVCLQLAQFAHAIPAVAMQIIFPWASAKTEKGKSLRQLPLKKYALYAGALCAILPLMLYFSLPVVLKIWMGEEFFVENITLGSVLLLAYGILAFNVPAHYLLMGLGKIKYLSLINLAAGLASVVTSLLLASLGLIWFSAAKLLFGPIILVNFIKLKKGAE